MDAVCEHVGFLFSDLNTRVYGEPTTEGKLRLVYRALNKRRAESYREDFGRAGVWDAQMEYYYSLAEAELSVKVDLSSMMSTYR